MTGLRVISYGGGVQSTALLVLAAQRVIDFETFLFANVGDDSEDPDTLPYITEVAAPYAAKHGIELHTLRHNGPSLYTRIVRDGSKSVPIPVRMANGMPGKRACTADYKIGVIGRWLKEHGATKDNKAVVGIGISLDEIERANDRRVLPHEQAVYPLLDHEPPLRRSDCEEIIRRAGLPVPPKSSCWFCPFHRPQVWAEMRRDRPDLFQRAADMEALINGRRSAAGQSPVWLTRFARPLPVAVPEAQAMLPLLDDGSGCDNGWCMT